MIVILDLKEREQRCDNLLQDSCYTLAEREKREFGGKILAKLDMKERSENFMARFLQNLTWREKKRIL